MNDRNSERCDTVFSWIYHRVACFWIRDFEVGFRNIIVALF
jgi:hypothetical protein